ncbi:MAG TPA: hypothetical protein VF618_13910 [Thermoanaerobaculia bacterium]
MANPNEAGTEALLTVFDANGEPHYFLTETVPANGYVQVNDILRGLPAGPDYTIEVVTFTGGYAYASIVHGSQDADFVPASDFVRGF